MHKSLLEESLDTMVDVSEAVEDNLPVRVFLYNEINITCEFKLSVRFSLSHCACDLRRLNIESFWFFH